MIYISISTSPHPNPPLELSFLFILKLKKNEILLPYPQQHNNLIFFLLNFSLKAMQLIGLAEIEPSKYKNDIS